MFTVGESVLFQLLNPNEFLVVRVTELTEDTVVGVVVGDDGSELAVLEWAKCRVFKQQ